MSLFDELVGRVSQAAGISSDQARAAVRTVVDHLGSVLPEPAASTVRAAGVMGGFAHVQGHSHGTHHAHHAHSADQQVQADVKARVQGHGHDAQPGDLKKFADEVKEGFGGLAEGFGGMFGKK